MIASVLQQNYEEIDVEQCNIFFFTFESDVSVFFLASIVGVCYLSFVPIIVKAVTLCKDCVNRSNIFKGKNFSTKTTLLIFKIIILCFHLITSALYCVIVLPNFFVFFNLYMCDINDQNMYLTWREITKCNSVTVRIILLRTLPFTVDVIFLILTVIRNSQYFLKLGRRRHDKIKDHKESQVQVLYLIKIKC